MITTRDILKPGERRGPEREARLSSAWQAIASGKGSKEDADLVLADLAETSEFYYVADPEATPTQLMRREGRREVMARILFLLDLPASYMTELRQAALDELQLTMTEG